MQQNQRRDMPNRDFTQYKPKAVLQRARDLQKIGNMRDACEYLFEVLTSRRMGRMFTPDHEAMMIEFINLCTDLRETRRTKDGLYFYRQLTQMQNPLSLEKVMFYMIDSAQKKAVDARARADIDLAAGGSTMNDLEEEEQSPEALLMGAVTSDGARERAEREVLAPWLRHVWDIYRNVLDNVRWVPKLEHVYHACVVKAMRFCRDFSRTSEFKKLVGMIRNHLAAQRRSQEANNVAMTQEQIERHLTTRFVQLEYCADMALWTEAFRAVEDIHGIMTMSDAPPRAVLMAAYYEKLSRIFWVSENYLFHAYAWYKFYALSAAQNKSLSEEDRRTMASGVVLAALSIPVQGGGAGGGGGMYGSAAALSSAASGVGVDAESAERDKRAKLAALLRHTAAASREALLAEIVAKGLLRVARPDVAALYRVLEVDFAPLRLADRAAASLGRLRAEVAPTLAAAGTLGAAAGAGAVAAAAAHTLSQYVPNLERLAVYRTLQQLSSVYSAVTLAQFRGLMAGLSLPYPDVEKLVVRAVRGGLLSVRIDHREGCMRLGNDALEASSMRRQLVDLAARLQGVSDAYALAPPAAAAGEPHAAAPAVSADLLRSRLFEQARATASESIAEVAGRIDLIERRKEQEERERQRKDKEVRGVVVVRLRVCGCMWCVACRPWCRRRPLAVGHYPTQAAAAPCPNSRGNRFLTILMSCHITRPYGCDAALPRAAACFQAAGS